MGCLCKVCWFFQLCQCQRRSCVFMKLVPLPFSNHHRSSSATAKHFLAIFLVFLFFSCFTVSWFKEGHNSIKRNFILKSKTCSVCLASQLEQEPFFQLLANHQEPLQTMLRPSPGTLIILAATSFTACKRTFKK